MSTWKRWPVGAPPLINGPLTMLECAYANSRDVSVMRRPAVPGRLLIFVRCGAERPQVDLSSFANSSEVDICYSFYARPRFDVDGGNLYVTAGGLSKYHAFQRLWQAEDALRRYDAYWFLDNDIEMDAADVLPLFNEGLGSGAALWQASLTPHSHSKWRHLYRLRGNVGLRYVNFVEVMAPFFTRPALTRCVDSFGEFVSTWGLDYAWSRLLPPGTLCVSDTYVMTHANQVDTLNGPYYSYLASIGIDPREDKRAAIRRYDAGSLEPGNVFGPALAQWAGAISRSVDPGALPPHHPDAKGKSAHPHVVQMLTARELLSVVLSGVLPAPGAQVALRGWFLRRITTRTEQVDPEAVARQATALMRLDASIGVICDAEIDRRTIQRWADEHSRHVEVVTVRAGDGVDRVVENAMRLVQTHGAKVLLLDLASPMQAMVSRRLAQCNDGASGLTIIVCRGLVIGPPRGATGGDVGETEERWRWRTRHIRKRVRRLLTQARILLDLRRQMRREP